MVTKERKPPVRNNPLRSVKASVSLTEHGGQVLAALVERRGGTRSTVVEEALMRMASQYRIEVD